MKSKEQNFNEKFSQYISNVLKAFEKGEDGKREMDEKNLHLIPTEKEIK